jgi:serine/threonine protein kinase
MFWVYRYFAVELFHATLEQFCSRQYHTGRMPSDAKVLCQIANGIDFLHRKGLAHGQLNPNTILIAQSNPVQMKVSEFGLSRCIRSQTDMTIESLSPIVIKAFKRKPLMTVFFSSRHLRTRKTPN